MERPFSPGIPRGPVGPGGPVKPRGPSGPGNPKILIDKDKYINL